MGKQNLGTHSDVLQHRPRLKNSVNKGNWHRAARTNKNLRKALKRFLGNPEDLDIRGLGRKVCEVLSVQSGDMIEFHVLADGSVRIVNYGS
ncbi:MAG TPA: hypothetical protein VLV31_04585 [Candidatus Acidoferrales bacterium]|nr:hypothetical protein [Candidatus Acidoferrales bacterium]